MKVVRESFDENAGLIKESTVFNSESKGTGSSVRKGELDPYGRPIANSKIGSQSRKPNGRTQYRARRRGRRAPGTTVPMAQSTRLAYKMFFIALLSFAFATTVTLLYNQTLLS